jgi:hypothetical protein
METTEETNSNGVVRLSGIGDGAVPHEFLALYQAAYSAGYSSGHDAGYRRGLESGRLEGQAAVHQNVTGSYSTAAALESSQVGIPKARLFALPCTTCRRFMYADETRCPYCKAPRQ